MTPKYLRRTRIQQHARNLLFGAGVLVFGGLIGAGVFSIVLAVILSGLLGGAAYAGSQATYHIGRRDGLIEAQHIVNGEQRGGYFKMPHDVGGQW